MKTRMLTQIRPLLATTSLALLFIAGQPQTFAQTKAERPATAFKYHRLDKNNAAVLLVDHQSGLISLVQDFSPGEFKNSVLALADTREILQAAGDSHHEF